MLLTTEPTESTFLFTSESVGEGHPDKVCDQIADAILDACLQQDHLSKVAIEAAARPGLIFVFGVLDTQAQLDIEAIVRVVLKDIGYDCPDQELDYKTCQVMDYVERRAVPEVAAPSVFLSPTDTEAAGDQGIIFGYASNETPQSLYVPELGYHVHSKFTDYIRPLTIDLSHRITRKMKTARLDGTLPWLRPDTKTQVTVEYIRRKNGETVPLRVHTVVLTAQHTQDVTVEELRKAVYEKVICKAIPAEYLDDQTAYYVRFPLWETLHPPNANLKITDPTHWRLGSDSVREVCRCHRSKDRSRHIRWMGRPWWWCLFWQRLSPGMNYLSLNSVSIRCSLFLQVDRSAAYMARWIAKSIVHAGLADRCLIQLSYSIGIAEPLSIFVETYGTGKMTDLRLEKVVSENFDMRPASIAKKLGLMNPIYYQTSKNGHFTNSLFPWEKPKDLVL